MGSYKVGMILSPRERQAAELLLQSKGSRDIAVEMGVCHQTAKRHLFHIFMKLGITDDRCNKQIRAVVILHENRRKYGIRCQACGELPPCLIQ